ncbi:unnamed protein product [Closterium sp. NIES-54]
MENLMYKDWNAENEAKIGMRFGEVKSSGLEHVELPLELSSGITTRQSSLVNGGEETKDAEEEEEEVQQVSERAPTLPSRTTSAPRIRATPQQRQGLHVPAAEEKGRGKRRIQASNRLTYEALGKPAKSALAGVALIVGDDEESDYEECAFAFFSPVEMPGEPATLKEALESSDAEEWKKTMESELKSIEENGTWELVELPEGRNAITSKWLFKIKSDADGKIERYKSKLVAKGYHQKEKEEIFMAQPEGFDDGSGRVLRLKKALYGLKQAPRQWYLKLRGVLEEIGFTPSTADHSLFMLGKGEQRSFMVVYVDDILIFSHSSDLVKEMMLKLQDKFKCKALGDVSFYLGLHIERDVEKRCMRVHQRKYLEALATNFGQSEGHVATPFPSRFKCVKEPEEERVGEEERRRFHSLVGSLMYTAVNTRPEDAFATGQLARVVQCPNEEQVAAGMKVANTTLTPLLAPVPVRLAEPSWCPVVASSSTVLPCPAVPSGSLSGLHLPLFFTNLVSTAALQDAMVTTTTHGGQRVSICTCTWTGHLLATFTRRPGSSLYTLTTEPPQVAASAQVSESSQVAASCSCRLLSHKTLLRKHRLGHPSLPRLRGMHSRFLASGLPRSLPPLPPSPAPSCLPCVEGWQRAAPHSSSFPPTTSPLQTLHMDVWGPACVSGQGRERYLFLRFGTDLPVLRLHSDRGGEFSSDLLREFCHGEGILQSFTLPDSPQQNGIAERRIGLVMEVARTSMIHATAPHFLWPFAVRYAAHQLNLWPCVSFPETSPALRWTGKVGDASVFRDVTFDESVPFYRLFPYRSAPPPPPPLFLTPGPPPVAVGSGAAPGAAYGGAASGGAASGGAEPGGAGSEGAGSGGAEPESVELGGAKSEGAEFGGAAPRETALSGGPARASPRVSSQQLREWLVRRTHRRSGAPGAGGARDTGARGAAVPPGASGTGSTATTGHGGARTSGAGSAGTSGVGSAGVGAPTEPGAAGAGGAGAGGAGVGDPSVGGAGAAGAGAVDPGAEGVGDTVRPRPQPNPLPAPSPYTEQSGSLTERCEPASDSARTASPTVARLLAIAVIDPSFESDSASALVAELLDFPAAYRLDYATALVAESVSASPLSIRDPDAPDIPTPRSYAEAITGPYSSQWQAAMDVEMASWKSTGTYVDEVPPSRANIVDGMWIFKVKRPPGSSPAFMARYVARGFSQRQGVDYFQTFSPTPKMTTLRVLLHVAAQHDYELHSLDFSTAFLQGSLHEEIWLRRTQGFTGTIPAATQWSLRRPVYGLRQVPRKWHDTLRTTLATLGFSPSTADPSLFLRTDTSLPPFYVLMYVDDLIFATADTKALTLVKSELQNRHNCTDLGELRSYLGLQITRDRARRTITLTQSHMVHQILQRFGFQFSSPQPTPLSTSHSLSAPPSDESVDPSGPYLELVGCLMYLMTCTRPDLAYPLSLLARYVAPGRHRKVHWDAAKRVLRYLCSTSSMGLVLGGRGPDVLTGHAHASWVDDSATQRSSQGYTFSLGSGFLLWRSTSSSCEAEIYAGAMAAQELRWLTYLLSDLGEQPCSPLVLYVDNKAMIALCQEHRLEHRTKHIALRYFLAREFQQRGQLRLAYVASRANTADVFTKVLPPGDHQRFATVLGLVPTVAHLLTA